MATLFALLGFIVIVVLAIVAYRLTRQVKEMEQEKRIQDKQRAEQAQQQKDYITESLQVISRNVIEEDLNLSEATIRCKMLLDGLLLSEEAKTPYAILESVYQQIKNLDTHASRKSLSASERKSQDSLRSAVEKENREELMSCFRLLQNFSLAE